MKGRICEADGGIIPIVSASRSPVASSHCTSPKVKPGHYSMHLSKLLNKHKTIESRALNVNSSLLQIDANKPNDHKNGYKTQISCIHYKYTCRKHGYH